MLIKLSTNWHRTKRFPAVHQERRSVVILSQRSQVRRKKYMKSHQLTPTMSSKKEIKKCCRTLKWNQMIESKKMFSCKRLFKSQQFLFNKIRYQKWILLYGSLQSKHSSLISSKPRTRITWKLSNNRNSRLLKKIHSQHRKVTINQCTPSRKR